MAAVPVTLSSAIVMTEICRGNRLWALFLTIGLNFLGLVSAPVMLKALLSQGAEVGISALRLMLQLVLLVLLPFVLGALARRLLPQGRTPRWLGLIPSLCVALTVYVVFAGAREALLATPLQAIFPAAGAAAVVHGILLGLAALGGMLMRLDSPECRALLFAASQKTLPLAVTVVALVLPGSPAALLPCLLFHFIQLFFDSFLASHLPRHGTTARVPG